ncbi:MAG: universal stress protein [Verrucomicrobiota bacterium]
MKVKPAPKRGQVVMEISSKDEPLLSRATPFKIGKVLVPVDFSECSLKALRYALAFAKQFNATLDLVHIVHVNFPGGEYGAIDYPLLEKQMVDGAVKQLGELVLHEVADEIPVETTVRVGRPATEIVTAANELGSDMIIMSTHGYTGLKHVFLGSTTENVVRYARCPVLVVREHEHEFLNG